MNFDNHTIAWQFHQNTCWWKHNTLTEPEGVDVTEPYKEYVNLPNYDLLQAKVPNAQLKEVIDGRHSCRNFGQMSMSFQDFSTILQMGYGVNNKIDLDGNSFYERPVPSGGGLYSLEVYLLVRNVENLDGGTYHFCIKPPCLEQLAKIKLNDFYINQLFMNQYYLANSSCILVITSCTERNMYKYGDRGYRYILFEAGHLAQNINLTAQALGLGSLNLGGFFDREMAELLEIDIDKEIPLYAIALGRPAASGYAKRRIPKSLQY